MSILEIILTAIGLSLDAVAVSVAAAVLQHLKLKDALKIALFFGGFQLAMPLLGFALASGFKEYFFNYGNIIGFVALFTLGSKMFYEALKKSDKDEFKNKGSLTNTRVLTLLAVTTSIDALVVGVTFNFIPVNIPLAVSVIGGITFCFCLLGVYIGSKSRELLGNRIEFFGAAVLMLLAFKILLY